jgi:adenylate cyclase
MDMLDKDRLLELHETIVAQALAGAAEHVLLNTVCDRLMATGVPLRRVMLGMEELHPTVEGQLVEWRRDVGTAAMRPYDRQVFNDKQEDWLRSPLYHLLTTNQTRLRRRIGDNYRQGEFEMIDTLFGEGARDYVAYCIPYDDIARATDQDRLYSSWTTDREGGFADEHVAMIDHIVPMLGLTFRSRAIARSANNMLQTYLGRDAGTRVLRGQVERGITQLVGFTRIADTVASEQVVPLLNDYADCQVAAIHEQGGEVLKFVGDGLLAIYPINQGHDPSAACKRALRAAKAAYQRLDALNRRRAAEGLATTKFFMALHIGEVLYGNIGSNERLDFTVVGPAVNEVSRIEALSRSIEREIIMSAAFAREAREAGVRLASLGRYALRGVARPQELFTLDDGPHP